MAVEHAELSEYGQCCRTAQDQSWDNVEQIQAYQYDLSSICNHDNLPFFFQNPFFCFGVVFNRCPQYTHPASRDRYGERYDISS